MRTGRPARQIDVGAVHGLLELGWSLRRVSRECGIPFTTLRAHLVAAGTLPMNPVTVEQFVKQGLAITFLATAEQAARLKVHGELTGMPEAEVIRRALNAYLLKAETVAPVAPI